jgi:thymidylate synthase (FAD)
MTVNLISITPDAEKTMAHIARVSNPDNQDNPNYAGFSQRYAKSNQLGEIELPELRRQDTKNRQNSIDDLDAKVVDKLNRQMITLFSSAQSLYNQMIEEGVAKECARMVLPLCTPTKIYMTGSCRSWIHYINLRSAHGTQKEHMVIAEGCRKVFTEQFPSVSEALEWV